MFMLDDGKLVDSNDCIIMQPTGRMEIHNKRMIYAGDIVRIIDPGNRYLNENFSGIGFIVFDTNKAQFIWRGVEYFNFPEYSMSGKAFEILGNVFEDRDILYDYKISSIGGLYGLANKGGQDFIQKFFEQSPDMHRRKVLIEKFISPQSIKLKEEKEIRVRIIKSEELRRKLRSIADSKRKERYVKIYEKIKQEINEGKTCV